MIAILVLCAAPTDASAQTRLQTYKSPDERFQFKYSRVLVRCSEPDRDEGKRGGWFPDSCDGYVPVCDERGDPANNTLVCLAYPKVEFNDYPTFEAATFSVALIETVRTERDCYSQLLNQAVDKPGSAKFAKINGVKFRIFLSFTSSSNQGVEGRLYRTFHEGSCYQLSIRAETVPAEIFDPGVKVLSKKDWANVNGRLEECLRSFRFLN
jgi:hypothetical protein